MIKETLSRNKNPAVTSDCWHVIHARWDGDQLAPLFVRSIVSEHHDRAAATRAAHDALGLLLPKMTDRSRETRDQVLVRRPSYKSLMVAKRVARRKP